MNSILRGLFTFAFGWTVLIGAGPALAAFPEKGKTITIIVPFAAGGTTDVSARLLAAQLQTDLGVTVQVLNKPGATTQIGNAETARAKPDGYTVVLASLPSISMTYLDAERKAPYKRESFTPIAHFISGANVIAVLDNSPLKSTKDMIAVSKTKPKSLRVGTVGLMSNSHLPGIALEEATGAQFNFVHFDGAAPMITALLAGDIDVGINGIQTTLPHSNAKKVRVIGYFGDKRTVFYPNQPTLREEGIELFAPSSFAILGPAGMPQDVTTTLSTAIKAAIDKPEFQTKLKDLALESDYMDPPTLARFWANFDKQQADLIALARKPQ